MTRAPARHPLTPALAALLLALQALGGAAVALAHARDKFSAPNAIEANHTAQCVILHDELRCALGQYAQSLVGAAAARVLFAVSRRPTVRMRSARATSVFDRQPLSTTRSRSPPLRAV